MNIGKAKYDNIEIPENLNTVLNEAIRKAKKERRARLRWVSSVAAVLCLLFLSANITPVYSYASQIPVIGSVVQILHIGTGGERTDGAQVGVEAGGESVQIRFENNSEQLDSVPVYNVSYLQAPNRMVLTLHGVRGMDFDSIRQSLLDTQAVQDVYRCMIGDDSSLGFVVVLNSGYTYEITEYENPASLSVKFFQEEQAQPEQTIYYLRSQAVSYGEELGMMSEQFFQWEATQLKTQEGDYILTIGQYATEEEAEAALQELEKEYGGETGLYVASGLQNEIPQN